MARAMKVCDDLRSEPTRAGQLRRAERIALVRAALLVDDSYVREAAARAIVERALEQWAEDDARGISRLPLGCVVDRLSCRMRRSDVRRARQKKLEARAIALIESREAGESLTADGGAA